MSPCTPVAIWGQTFLAQTNKPITLVGRPTGRTPESYPFLLPSVLCALCVAALVAVVVRARRRRAGAPGRRALMLLARSAQLSAPERALIERIGAPEPAALLISEHALCAAVERWGKSGPSEADRRVLASLAARLGWAVPEIQPELGAPEKPRRSSRQAVSPGATPARTVRSAA